MVSIKELRRFAFRELKNTENDSPLADIDVILLSMGFTKTDIYIGEKNLDQDEVDKFTVLFERLKSGEPVQYIVGQCEFMSLPFKVNKSTLIPRGDTEVLVEEVIKLLKDKKETLIFEIGSGSGCISVSIAKYIESAKVLSVDISEKAVETAKENADLNGVSDRVCFLCHDIMKGFPEKADVPDIVVSNPPYIKKADIVLLDKKVKDFEPLSALVGGDDGLLFYKFISQNIPVKKGGYLFFEVGIGQAEEVKKIMLPRFADIQTIKDLQGIDRVVLGRKK